VPGLNTIRYETGREFLARGDAIASYTESFRRPGGAEVALTWDKLGEPFLVEFSKDKSATGAHEMFSLFIPAAEARVSFDGEAVGGKPVPRDVHGKASSSAFLAFSETWVKSKS
jgi:hypothetical protein